MQCHWVQPTGPAKKELQWLIRRASRLTFAEACREAKEVEKEDQAGVTLKGVEARQTFLPLTAATPGSTTSSTLDLEALWVSLKEELQREVCEQMRGLREVLVTELRQVREDAMPPAGAAAYNSPSCR